MGTSLTDESAPPILEQPSQGLRVIAGDRVAAAARETQSHIAVHASRAGIALTGSRLIGLVRELTIAALFGAGLATDAFNVAFRIPNLLRDLFTEGALPALFVPTFTEVRKQGEAEAQVFARQLMATLFTVSILFCALAYVFAPALCRMLAPGFAAVPGKLQLTVSLMRLMLPLVPAVTIAAVSCGVLNARSRFVIPAVTPAMLSIGIIVGTLSLVPLCRAWGQPPIFALGLGVVLGGILMVVFQLPSLHALGFKLRPERPRAHPAVLRLGVLMLPATLGLAANNVNLFASTLFASLLSQGSVSWLWYAYRVVQLPAGVLGAALATVSLTSLSRAAMDRDMESLKSTLSGTLRLVFTLTIPASLWVAVMARPIVALLYEHGAFRATDSLQTAGAVQMYCVGLPAIAACGIFTRTFYALGDSATPVRSMLVSGCLGLMLNILVVGPLRRLGLGQMGLALSTSLATIANLLILRRLLTDKIGRFGGARIVGVALRSSLVAGLAMLPTAAMMAIYGVPPDRLGAALAVAGSLASAVLLGWWIMALLKAEELPVILGAFGSSLKGRPVRPLA